MSKFKLLFLSAFAWFMIAAPIILTSYVASVSLWPLDAYRIAIFGLLMVSGMFSGIQILKMVNYERKRSSRPKTF